MEEVTARVEEIPPLTLEQLQAEFDALPDSPIEVHPRLRKYAAFEHLDGTPYPSERVQEEAPLYAWFTSLHAKYGFLLASLAAAQAENTRLREDLAAAWAEAERQDALIAARAEAIIADMDEARQGLEGVRAAFLTGKDGSAAADRIFAALSRLRNAVPQELRAAVAGRAESAGEEA